MPEQFQVLIESPAPAAALDLIDAGIEEHNGAAAPLGDVKALHVTVRDAEGTVVGGAVGRSWGACCELQQLWVLPALRSQGLGRRLMAAFEQGAQARGCALVYLETFSFQAPAFYRSLGYVEVLRIEGYTGGVVKFTLHKTLSGSGVAPAPDCHA